MSRQQPIRRPQQILRPTSRRLALWFVAGALLLGIGLGLYSRNEVRLSQRSQDSVPDSVPAASAASTPYVGSTNPHSDTTPVRSQIPAPRDSAPATPSSGEALQLAPDHPTPADEPQGSVALADATPDVAGRPFPLSPSVEAACKAPRGDCEDTYEVLQKLASERREPVWAKQMEDLLRENINTVSRESFRSERLSVGPRCVLLRWNR
jgi:hypothetical protein